MSTPKHSPLPWRIAVNGFVHDACDDLVEDGFADENSIANTRLIVRAVNSHDALLAAAKASLDVWENMHAGFVSPHKLEAAIDSCKAAIAQAEELAP
jgi:hypothetical protein